MDALTTDLACTGLTLGAGVWVYCWEMREQRIQAWLKTVVIKFRSVGEDHEDAPGYFVWKSVQPPRAPSATETTNTWWNDLSEDDQQAIEQLDEITTGRVA